MYIGVSSQLANKPKDTLFLWRMSDIGMDEEFTSKYLIFPRLVS
jgi:hypothetical protein